VRAFAGDSTMTTGVPVGFLLLAMRVGVGGPS
jgi:hypothetical protein